MSSIIRTTHKQIPTQHYHEILGSIWLIGCASRSGSASHNAVLAQRRVASVKRYVEGKLYNSATRQYFKIYPMGMGEARAALRGMDNDTESAQDRAVIVVARIGLRERVTPGIPSLPRIPKIKDKGAIGSSGQIRLYRDFYSAAFDAWNRKSYDRMADGRHVQPDKAWTLALLRNKGWSASRALTLYREDPDLRAPMDRVGSHISRLRRELEQYTQLAKEVGSGTSDDPDSTRRKKGESGGRKKGKIYDRGSNRPPSSGQRSERGQMY